MNTDSGNQVAALLARKLGLHISCEVSGGEMVIFPSAHDSRESFSIRFLPGWRSAEAFLNPGPFAGAMVRAMGAADLSAKMLFVGYIAGLKKAGVRIAMKINANVVEPENPATWPQEWVSFEISLRKTALVFDLNKDEELLPIADLLLVPITGMAMALIGTENIGSFEGEIEGAAVQYLATRYERKKINRDACIRIHGLRCAACGFSFEEHYGDIAADYIEIHHIESLAVTGEVRINPALDLIPLCSNCHSVVHRATPPLPISGLRQLIQERTCP